jgi:hypothetical protein
MTKMMGRMLITEGMIEVMELVGMVEKVGRRRGWKSRRRLVQHRSRQLDG